MKKLLTFVLFILCASPVLAIETGKYEGVMNDKALGGRVTIDKSGTQYKIPELIIFRKDDPTQYTTCSIFDGQVKQNGDELVVSNENDRIVFTIKEVGNSIQIIPHLVMDDPHCAGTEYKFLGDTQDEINDKIKEISDLKWNKVKHFKE